MYKTKILSQEECLKRWNEIEPCLERALKHSRGEWTPFQIMKEVMNNPSMFHIWDVLDPNGSTIAIGSTRILQYNNYRSLHIITLANIDKNVVFDSYSQVTTILEDEARKAGLQRVEFTGRKGWLKVLKKLGYNEQYITMDKLL